MSTRVLAGVLLLLFVLLQYALWAGKNSVLDLVRLRATLEDLTMQNQSLRHRNDRLHADVVDIKSRLSAIEAQARSELGFLKPGETYYQVIETTVPKE
ncbi:MAG: septum formation initiator family protein [Pseudomonadota bacterium]|jgi:cell division protein FtsB|nr:septum formation initiator family protein [Pseudomonadota bacterium]